MNDKSNSLISAYHDGELSAAERTEVERLLASSPKARAELEAYRQVSNLLREAGRPTLTADLTPHVMHAIQRQKLQPSRGTGRAAWTKWAALAAVAAGLFVAVKIGRQPAPEGPREIAVNNGNNTTPIEVPKPNNNTPANNNVAVTTPNPATPQAPELVNVQLSPEDLPLEVIENLKHANPGKIVRFLKQSGKDVAVFHLMVLDTKPGLESLQMILSAQQISGPKGQAGQSGVMAVYVEANQDQLDKVIAELQREDQTQFVALAVQSPMKAEDVQKVVKNQSTDVASQQVPVKPDELKSLGVNPVQSQQIATSINNRSSRPPSRQQASGGDDSPMRKLLIVLEKVPESLLPKPAIPPN